jgi:hypothetical protein
MLSIQRNARPKSYLKKSEKIELKISEVNDGT